VTTPDAQAQLKLFAEALLPELRTITPFQGWADLRPGLKGLHPLLGPVPGVQGLYIAAGHYRNGLCLAPVTGEIIAALLAHEPPPVAAEPWVPKPA
jgi:glycine oxidase